MAWQVQCQAGTGARYGTPRVFTEIFKRIDRRRTVLNLVENNQRFSGTIF